ncbi:tetratricopeptide repeat protein [Streptomyces sp. ZYX-F-203]
MTDQAVDTEGRRLSEPRSATPGFLGRTRELRELRADVERAGLDTIAGRKAPRARVLLVAGGPGSGRTALAEEFAAGIADRYPDGMLRARLREPDGTRVPAADIAREFLGALGAPPPPGADEDDLCERLRVALADRRALLLLDDAVDAEQVDALLPDTPDCLAVVVSVGPLTGIVDVRPCTLGGLDTKSAVELLSRRIGSVRVTVDPRAAEHLAEECRGRPATLALAAGWLIARPQAGVADIARQLHTESVVDDCGTPLSRVLRLLHDALPGDAARMLRLLSLAPAGLVDPHTAAALAGTSVDRARTTLDGFVTLGLVRSRDTDPREYEVPGCLRPLLTDLTEGRDRPAELRLARARMLERQVRLLQSCRAAVEPDRPAADAPPGVPEGVRFPSAEAAADWLRVRRPALLAAARLAVADGGLDTLARRLLAQLVRALVAHLGTRGAAADLYGVHRLVLDVAERRDLPREAAAALLNLADLDARTGRTEQALTRYRAALEAGRRAGDPYATGRATESVGGAHLELGDWDRAVDWFGRALAQRLARAERAEAARLYGRIAAAHTYAGRYGEAARAWRASIAGYRRAGDAAGHARALSELARVQEYAGRPEESLRTCREAVERARCARDGRLQAALHLRLADTLDRLGDPVGAAPHRGLAARMLEEDRRNACETPSASGQD